MLDMIATIKDPSKITDEQVAQAYQMIKEYCEAEGKDVMEVLNNDENIKPASEKIHSEMPFLVRKMIKATKIEELIMENLDFIRTKAQEQYDLENPPAKAPKKKAAKKVK